MGNLIPKIKTLFMTGFFHIFGSSALNKVIAFLSSVVLVHILTKTEFGTFTYAWNIYSIILIFNGMGIDSGVLQVSSEHSGDISFGKRISNYGIRFGIKFDLILAIIILTIGMFAPLKIDDSRQILISLFALPMVHLLFLMSSSFLRAQKKNQEFASLTVFNTTVLFLTTAIGAYLFREIGLVAGYYIAYLCTYFFGFKLFGTTLFQREKPVLGDECSALMKISFITMLNNGLSQLMYLIDVFILGIVDPNEIILASYKVATMIPTALTFIPLAMITYLYPYFAEHQNDRKWCRTHYKYVLLGMGGFNLFIALIMFAFAPFIVQLVFGAQYADAVPVFRILSINYFFSGTFRILSGNLLVTQRKLKFNLLVAIVSSSINIIADYFFIQWWGSIGAAYATFMVVIISSVLSTSYLVYTFNSDKRISTVS